ncbi:MAG: hypothetical protein JXA67_19465 [Micromonosporaceae bacterium]|nr:hypothetical protein [Micromonosporaceae bacterium]
MTANAAERTEREPTRGAPRARTRAAELEAAPRVELEAAPRVELEAAPRAGPTRPMTAAAARGLQRSIGNRAVSQLMARRQGAARRQGMALRQGAARPEARRPAVPGTAVVQRLAGAPASAPAAPAAMASGAARGGPGTDPKFAALTGEVRDKQRKLATHPPAKAEASAAQAAAVPPQDDREAQGKAASAEKMNAAKPGEFDQAAFIRAVNEAITAKAPKNLDEADKFGSSGAANSVKDQVSGQVAAGKQASAGQIESATKAPPDTAQAKDKPVTPLRPDQPPATPAAPDAAKAVPDRAPPSATDFSAGPAQVADQMAEAQVTEGQLAAGNEPAFDDALAAKREGETHAATAPAQIRAAEGQTLASTKAQAAQAGAAAMTGMAADSKRVTTAVGGGKAAAKGSDEAKRAQVTATLQKVFDATKRDVETILSGLDKKVDSAFDSGERAAREAFTAEHKRRMDEYKDKRYSGVIGKGRWLKDKFAGLPEEANQIFVQARAGYVSRMQQVIGTVADLIGAQLRAAKQRIATGRAALRSEVARLPKDLQAIGKETAQEFSGKFDELTETVNAKGQELVQTLADRYTEALAKVDEDIAAEKEKNKGLVAKAMDAVGGVIKTILELKAMLLGMLAKAASAVMAILKDPIGFLGNLVSAVGAGLRAFLGNIGNHLKRGLVGWLLGAMAGAGLQLPAKFDLKGIIGMIASLLGLTWGAIRGRIVAKGVPERAMGAVEASVPIAQKIQAGGIAGIWEEIKAKAGDLKENLFSKIVEYLVPAVLIAGITWIVSLLNPASAFVKACKMIVDIVSFIVNQGAQIIAFVNSVLDAVIAIAGGGGGGVPGLIEKALAASIPVLIGALAAILGIGGIAEKVKKFFQSLSKPVMKAVDWVVGKIVKLGKKLWAKLKKSLSRRRRDNGQANGSRGNAGAGADADLAAQLGSEIEPERLRTVLGSIYRKWAPKGLRALESVRRPGRPGEFGVFVTASPRRLSTVFKLKEPEEQFAIPDDVDLSNQNTPTYASGAIRWPGGGTGLPKVSSAGGVHAEENLLGFLTSGWEGIVPNPRTTRRRVGEIPPADLDIKVTRSPCPSCAAKIAGLPHFGRRKGYDLRVAVRALGLYHGTSIHPTTRKAVQDERGKTRGKWVGIKGLTMLRAAGVEVGPLTLSDVTMRHFGKAADTRLIKMVAKWNLKLIKELNKLESSATIRHGK